MGPGSQPSATRWHGRCQGWAQQHPASQPATQPATHPPTCKAWMSKMTTDAGPPRAKGMFEMMRARVKAVATSPSASTRSAVPEGGPGVGGFFVGEWGQERRHCMHLAGLPRYPSPGAGGRQRGL